ncbi:MATE family efflux transporter [Candidatus Mycoplasma mahonii]|uniref:MATE family efflux transporter n=1 Tax=Candidatus Mycoplasma mahonii TaxID=3004105 RepID=UPI0026EB6A04|nr:MATE family efflux transporter [Candidatus Mycoplasma mahonii]WKX02425.1 MATE family efflux transporter [Candidatus Mycoplasma mahonii]
MNLKVKYWDKKFILKILKVAAPFIVLAIIDSLMSLIDGIMVGNFQTPGSSEMAAVSLGNKYSGIAVIVIGAFIAMFSFLVMQYKGANNHKKIKSVYKIITIGIFAFSAIFILCAYFATDEIMRFFQGTNMANTSTASGEAQDYTKVIIWKIIPLMLSSSYMQWLTANKKQKIIIPLSLMIVVINAFGNYLFYRVFSLGLVGVAWSTVTVECFLVIAIGGYIWFSKIDPVMFFNPLKIFQIDKTILLLGLKRSGLFIQNITFSLASIGVMIIYSRWYGDGASNVLAIVQPILMMFYLAFNGVGRTKGIFVGYYIGKGDREQAYINDKKLNMYTFITALVEGTILAAVALPIPLMWGNISHDIQLHATLVLLAVACTYPFAAISKSMLLTFKAAGMGKEAVMSNGVFSVIFEFGIPLTLYLIDAYVAHIGISFWQLYWISRLIKLVKIPPTYIFYKKYKWLDKAI